MSVVLFSQFIKHLNVCVFSFNLNGNLGSHSGRLELSCPFAAEETEARTSWLRPRSSAF